MNIIIIVSFLTLSCAKFSRSYEGSIRPYEELPKSLTEDAQKIVSKLFDKVTSVIPLLKSAADGDCVKPPQECPNVNVSFWYYSRSNPEVPVELSLSNLDLLKNLSRNENVWKIVIHGYTKSKNDIPNPQLRSAYFAKGDFNLISVDYEPLARDKCYVHAVANVPLIANCTAQIIDALMDKQWFHSNNLHIIGFSLGAQIAGLIHTHMKHSKPRRVTGLDPASPLFDGFLHPKLNSSAAEFVDVIHTNALFKGKLESSGHVDFYVNGGLSQPGCLTNSNESFSTCSHDRSPLYFAESINSKDGFWGIPCNSYLKFYSGLCDTEESQLIPMGEYVPQEARGKYYLQTADKEPFALGKKAKIIAAN